MQALAVYAHPLTNSLNRRFLDTAITALKRSGNSVDLVDLYADGFDPRLTAAERSGYYEPRQSHNPYHEQLSQADILLLVFPTWWFSPPAILKGFIDRAFAPGTAFAHTENHGPIKPLLKLRHTLVITSLGSPWWVDRLVMRRPVRRVLKTGVIGTCAPGSTFTYLPFYAAEKPTLARVEAFCTAITSRCAKLER